MSARFVYWMNVSLDLMIEQHAGDHNNLSGPDWIRLGAPLHREFNARARAMSAMVEGRVIYEMMDPFWPDARGDGSLPDFLREYAEIWTSMPKMLVSHTRTLTPELASHNTRIIGGDDAIDQLAALRQDAEGDIAVGGATLATQLLRAGLLDELMLFTHPVILGSGRRLFDDPRPRVNLDLIEEQTYDQGVTLHRYAVRGVV
ncbi:dihydrofolate reductase family protein [Arthrobacter sp. ISL-28]|uniref:dihydrofolate reductase family protein n=1 Tax=Arthrobacter sp. ISL-28 TaxID=2819108 RepID=UPI001BE64308|nr:dihydrofolate reductase family protein [Arthrobacter sp. ISL-28]MBT2521740.1 dihydrofolate reductase family protein [Arthrobacter sp. ISL-28]